MTQVTRITNPNALLVEGLQALFTRAFKDHPYIAPFDEVAEEFVLVLQNPNVGVFAGVEKGEFKALAVVEVPASKLALWPQVLQFANFGSAKLRDALVQAVVDFVVQAGYTRFLATNTTGKGDEAYGRLFKKAGRATKVSSVLEFEIGS